MSTQITPYINKAIAGAANQSPTIPAQVLQGSLLEFGTLNPGVIQANQLETLVVGNLIGQVKEPIYTYAISNTNKLFNIVSETNGPVESQQVETRQQINSILGTKVFDNIIFKPLVYFNYDSINTNGVITTNPTRIEFNGLQLDSCIISATRENNVVQTQTISSKAGSIKEFVSAGEYNISLQAYVTAQNLTTKRLEYNVPALQEIEKLINCNQSIEIQSYFLQLLGITNVVLISTTLTQVQGFSGIVELQMQLISDTPIKLNK